MSTDRRDRLPKWAQDEIAGLERDVARLSKRLEEVPEEGAVAFTDAYGFMTGRRRPVGRFGEAVRFYLSREDAEGGATRNYIEASAAPGHLTLMCDQQLVLLTQASNVVRAEVRDR